MFYCAAKIVQWAGVRGAEVAEEREAKAGLGKLTWDKQVQRWAATKAAGTCLGHHSAGEGQRVCKLPEELLSANHC